MTASCAAAEKLSSSANQTMAGSHASLNRFFSIKLFFTLERLWFLHLLFAQEFWRRQIGRADSPHTSCDADSAFGIHHHCGSAVSDLPGLPRKHEAKRGNHEIFITAR